MPTITPIRAVKGEPDKALIERLEGLLALARSGELTAFAAAFTMTSNRIGFSYDWGDNPQDLPRIIAGLELVKAKALDLYGEVIKDDGAGSP